MTEYKSTVGPMTLCPDCKSGVPLAGQQGHDEWHTKLEARLALLAAAAVTRLSEELGVREAGDTPDGTPVT